MHFLWFLQHGNAGELWREGGDVNVNVNVNLNLKEVSGFGDGIFFFFGTIIL